MAESSRHKSKSKLHTEPPKASAQFPFLPSKEVLEDRVIFWDAFMEKYENKDDHECYGCYIEEVIESAKAAKESSKNVSDQESTVNSSMMALKSAMDDDDVKDKEFEEESELSDADFVEEEEEKPREMQLVPYRKMSKENKWQLAIQEHGPEFVKQAKRAVRKQNEELSKINYTFWNSKPTPDQSSTSSSSRFYEVFNESCLETPGAKSYSRQHSKVFEQTQNTSGFNFTRPAKTFDNQDDNQSRQFMNMMQNSQTGRYKIVERIFERYFEKGDTSMPAPAFDAFAQNPVTFKPEIKIEILSSDDESRHTHSKKDKNIFKMPSASLKPRYNQPGQNPCYELSIAKPTKPFISESGTSKSKSIRDNSHNMSRASSLTSVKKNDRVAEKQNYSSDKALNKMKSFTPEKKNSKHELSLKSHHKSSNAMPTRPYISGSGTSKSHSSKSKSIRDNSYNMSRALSLTSMKKNVKVAEKKNSSFEKVEEKKKMKSFAPEKKKLQLELSPVSALLKDTESLNLDDISIGSSYCTESSDDEKYFNKEKFEKIRQNKLKEYKKKKLLTKKAFLLDHQKVRNDSKKCYGNDSS